MLDNREVIIGKNAIYGYFDGKMAKYEHYSAIKLHTFSIVDAQGFICTQISSSKITKEFRDALRGLGFSLVYENEDRI